MDEMYQDLGMTGVFEKRRQTLPVCRGFSKSLARRGMVRLAERDCCGTGRHKKSLNLGIIWMPVSLLKAVV